MIGFLFFLALQPILRKTECRVNLRYVQVVYINSGTFEALRYIIIGICVILTFSLTILFTHAC